MRKLVEEIFYYRNRIDRNKTREYQRLYSESQYWPKKDIEAYQLRLFNSLWMHARKYVPYYRQLTGGSGNLPGKFHSMEELREIPLLTKERIRVNFDRLQAENISRERFAGNSTSGYSGSNLHFYSDRNDRESYTALSMRRYQWMDASIFDREMVIWGTTWDLPGETAFTRIKRVLGMENTINISGYQLSDDDMINIHRRMVQLNPRLLKSYPSILYKIAEFFNQNRLTYQPWSIHTGGEKLHGFQRETIESVFHAKVYDFYGARDMSNIAQNCSHFNGLHVFMENVIVEVLNEAGEPVFDEEGDLVVTNLHNEVMPFIRYKIGDRGILKKDSHCECGRNLVMLKEISGRSFDILEFPNGNRVGGSFWTLVARSLPGIRDFQVVQESITHIRFIYVRDPESEPLRVDLLKKRIREYSGNELKIEFEETDHIVSSKAGKTRFVISKLKE